jgi:hypothetical protein
MTDASGEMALILQENRHSAGRLVWLFARSTAVALVFASAVCAGLYVVRDIRARQGSSPPSDAVSLPAGLELLTPLADAVAFERMVGFAPVVPLTLPDGTDSVPRLHATQAGADGVRTGELRFPAAGGGPSILVRESKRSPAGSELRPMGPGTFGGSLQCGAIAVDVTLYFAAGRADAPAVAAAFMRSLAAQCEG